LHVPVRLHHRKPCFAAQRAQPPPVIAEAMPLLTPATSVIASAVVTNRRYGCAAVASIARARAGAPTTRRIRRSRIRLSRIDVMDGGEEATGSTGPSGPPQPVRPYCQDLLGAGYCVSPLPALSFAP
jgi:hypothetical protein